MIRCSVCTSILPREALNTRALTPCPSCGTLTRADVFPALFRKTEQGNPGELLLMDDEASCFYHPDKQAVIPCDSCGRFLCSLCDIELDNRHLCASCLETGQEKGKIKNLENHRTLYDSIALHLAVLPVFIWFTTIITAPVTIFLVIRHWKTPSSIIRRTKIRMILATLIAGGQIVGWTALIYSMASG